MNISIFSSIPSLNLPFPRNSFETEGRRCFLHWTKEIATFENFDLDLMFLWSKSLSGATRLFIFIINFPLFWQQIVSPFMEYARLWPLKNRLVLHNRFCYSYRFYCNCAIMYFHKRLWIVSLVNDYYRSMCSYFIVDFHNQISIL